MWVEILQEPPAEPLIPPAPSGPEKDLFLSTETIWTETDAKEIKLN